MATYDITIEGEGHVGKLDAQAEKIRAAEAAGRSESTLNRLWREYFKIESGLKASGAWL